MPILMGVNRMSMMREIPSLLATHYIVIAMRPITFPATKAQIIERVGDEMIPTSPDGCTPLRELVKKIPLERFGCAAEFYCAFNAS